MSSTSQSITRDSSFRLPQCTSGSSLTTRWHSINTWKTYLPRHPSVALICRLSGTTWCALTRTLHTSTQALVSSTAEYCSPVWCRSSHTKKLDMTLNTALRTVSGCLHATPVNQLPILAGIAPPMLHHEAAVLALSREATNDEDQLLHKTAFSTRPPSPQDRHRDPATCPPEVAMPICGARPPAPAFNTRWRFKTTLAQVPLDGGIAGSWSIRAA